MTLVEEVQQARVELARASYDLENMRNGLHNRVGDAAREQTGVSLRQLEVRVDEAKAKLERVEADVVDRARAIGAERDPGYAAKLSAANLLTEVEQSALIGAADRLVSE